MNFWRRLFTRRKTIFGKPEKEIDFSRTREFHDLNEFNLIQFHSMLIALQTQPPSKNLHEGFLNVKKLTTFTDVDQLFAKVSADIVVNYESSKEEFDTSDIQFRYLIGNDITFTDSVEIVQEVFHTERNDLGKIYISFVVKFKDGVYYYWK